MSECPQSLWIRFGEQQVSDLKICSGKCFLEPKHEVAHMYMLTDAMDEMVFKSPLLC